jgi:hypothetical protein
MFYHWQVAKCKLLILQNASGRSSAPAAPLEKTAEPAGRGATHVRLLTVWHSQWHLGNSFCGVIETAEIISAVSLTQRKRFIAEILRLLNILI